MRTPSAFYESSVAAQRNEQQSQNHFPAIINRNYKRKSSDIDLSQPQAKSNRKIIDHQIYYQTVQHGETSLMNTEYLNNSVTNNLNNNNNLQNSAIEYIFDSNLLPVQNHIISEANSLNLNELSATWNNAEILDLDCNKDNSSEINDLSANNGGHYDHSFCSDQQNYNDISKYANESDTMKSNNLTIKNHNLGLTRKYE